MDTRAQQKKSLSPRGGRAEICLRKFREGVFPLTRSQALAPSPHKKHGERVRCRTTLAALLLLTLLTPAHTQEAGDDAARTPEELEVLEGEIEIRRSTEEDLSAEAEALASEIERLRSRAIEAAAAIQENERERTRLATELPVLETRLGEARVALERKRESLGPMLAVLQRLRRNPPPAVFMAPEDGAEAARAAMMMSALTRQLVREAESLRRDLSGIEQLIAGINSRRTALEAANAEYARARTEIDGLVEAKRTLQERTMGDLAVERARLAELSGRAADMQALMAWLDEDAPAGEVPVTGEVTETPVTVTAGQRHADFGSLKGHLPLPANGTLAGRFRDPVPPAGEAMGIRLATAPLAQVTAPADGEIVFAGTFEGYGQLLILSAGDGYFLLLAGFGRMDATLGQFVLTGEPLGLMPASNAALYVELQRNRNPVDPWPWFAADAEAGG